MDDALASGDVDAVRRLLAAQAAQPTKAAPARPGPASEQLDPLTARADALATSLLSRGLAVLERAESASAAVDSQPPQRAQTITLPEFGLQIVDSPVMGQTVWPAALALARWLKSRGTCQGAHTLELGAGSGAPGLVALSLGAASLTLTDADADLLPLMQSNAELNARGAACSVRELDWRQPEHVSAARAARPEGFALLLAADVTFGVGDFEPLARAAAALLARTPAARLLLARSAWFEDLQPTLLAAVETAGLRLVGASVDGEAGAAVLEIEWAEARE